MESRKAILNYSYNPIGDAIGEGCYSTVFRGKNDKTGQTVAIKVVKKEKVENNPILLECFINEISNLIYIKGDNILQFLDVVQTPNNIYIVTEFCNSGNLETLLLKYRGKGLPEPQCLDILRQVACAFVQISQLNIRNKNDQNLTLIHRDIKPANILFNDNKVKLADFGFSKMISTKEDKLSPKVQLGTPNYMSPQILGIQEYSVKTDVWSAGVVFYEMLYGKLPWQATDLKSLCYNIKNVPLQIPIDKKFSDSTKDLLKKMLMIDEDRRTDWVNLLLHPAIQDLMDSK